MKRIGVALAVLLPLAGCNGDRLSNNHGDSKTGGLNQQNSQQVGEAIRSAVTGGGAGSSGGASSITGVKGSATFRRASVPQAHANAEGDCYSITGDQSDADQDGIPADATYILTNCTYSDQGWTETYDGKEEFIDSNPTVADWAYTDNYDLNAAFSDGTDSEADHMVGNDASTVDGSVFGYHEVFNDDFSGSYQGQNYSGNYAEDFVWTFSPGCDPNSGAETVDGSWSETFNSDAVSATIATTDPLIVDSTCDSGVVSGTIVATSGDATETITWTACDVYTDTYNGPQS